MKLKSIFQIWKNKNQILEGIANSIFRKEDVEAVASVRMAICKSCDLFTNNNDGCLAPLSSPCCDQRMGGCGCSLGFKTRSMSAECPKLKWKAEMTEDEEDKLNEKLGI